MRESDLRTAERYQWGTMISDLGMEVGHRCEIAYCNRQTSTIRRPKFGLGTFNVGYVRGLYRRCAWQAAQTTIRKRSAVRSGAYRPGTRSCVVEHS